MYSIYNIIGTFIAGLIVGGTLGVTVAAMCKVSKSSDEQNTILK